MANRRKHNPVARGRIPDEFILVADERPLAFRGLEYNQMSFSSVHAAAWLYLYLRIVETAILTVRSLTWLAAPEVT